MSQQIWWGWQHSVSLVVTVAHAWAEKMGRSQPWLRRASAAEGVWRWQQQWKPEQMPGWLTWSGSGLKGVLEKPTTPGGKEQATSKMNKGVRAEEASVAGSEGMGLPEWQRWPGVFGAREGWQLKAVAYSIYMIILLSIKSQESDIGAKNWSQKRQRSYQWTNDLLSLSFPIQKGQESKAVPTTFCICLCALGPPALLKLIGVS